MASVASVFEKRVEDLNNDVLFDTGITSFEEFLIAEGHHFSVTIEPNLPTEARLGKRAKR